MFKKGSISFKAIAGLVAVTFVFSILMVDLMRVRTTQASMLGLPEPAQLLPVSDMYSLPILRGLKLDPANPLNMQFIVDTADKEVVSEEESARLVKYFLAGLTVPDESLWVNLSPYEEDRIIDDNLGVTDLGKDLLGQDYVLKQLMSSMTHPETDTGSDFWSQAYERLMEVAGTTNLPVNTFNKIWIVPDAVEVHEDNGVVLITDASLKAMLEEDYLAFDNNMGEIKKDLDGLDGVDLDQDQIQQISAVSSDLIREVVVPAVTDDVNNGENFARLRQVYHSLILANWFKKKFQQSFYSHYMNQAKVNGIDIEDKASKEKIYSLYVDAFKKGVYNFVKKEREPGTKKTINRRYFSGGLEFTPEAFSSAITTQQGFGKGIMNAFVGGLMILTAALTPVKAQEFELIEELPVSEIELKLPDVQWIPMDGVKYRVISNGGIVDMAPLEDTLPVVRYFDRVVERQIERVMEDGEVTTEEIRDSLVELKIDPAGEVMRSRMYLKDIDVYLEDGEEVRSDEKVLVNVDVDGNVIYDSASFGAEAKAKAEKLQGLLDEARSDGELTQQDIVDALKEVGMYDEKPLEQILESEDIDDLLNNDVIYDSIIQDLEKEHANSAIVGFIAKALDTAAPSKMLFGTLLVLAMTLPAVSQTYSQEQYKAASELMQTQAQKEGMFKQLSSIGKGMKRQDRAVFLKGAFGISLSDIETGKVSKVVDAFEAGFKKSGKKEMTDYMNEESQAQQMFMSLSGLGSTMKKGRAQFLKGALGISLADINSGNKDKVISDFNKGYNAAKASDPDLTENDYINASAQSYGMYQSLSGLGASMKKGRAEFLKGALGISLADITAGNKDKVISDFNKGYKAAKASNPKLTENDYINESAQSYGMYQSLSGLGSTMKTGRAEFLKGALGISLADITAGNKDKVISDFNKGYKAAKANNPKLTENDYINNSAQSYGMYQSISGLGASMKTGRAEFLKGALGISLDDITAGNRDKVMSDFNMGYKAAKASNPKLTESDYINESAQNYGMFSQIKGLGADMKTGRAEYLKQALGIDLADLTANNANKVMADFNKGFKAAKAKTPGLDQNAYITDRAMKYSLYSSIEHYGKQLGTGFLKRIGVTEANKGNMDKAVDAVMKKAGQQPISKFIEIQAELEIKANSAIENDGEEAFTKHISKSPAEIEDMLEELGMFSSSDDYSSFEAQSKYSGDIDEGISGSAITNDEIVEAFYNESDVEIANSWKRAMMQALEGNMLNQELPQALELLGASTEQAKEISQDFIGFALNKKLESRGYNKEQAEVVLDAWERLNKDGNDFRKPSIISKSEREKILQEIANRFEYIENVADGVIDRYSGMTSEEIMKKLKETLPEGAKLSRLVDNIEIGSSSMTATDDAYGGIDLKNIDVKADASSAMFALAPFDVENFAGFEVAVVSLEEGSEDTLLAMVK